MPTHKQRRKDGQAKKVKAARILKSKTDADAHVVGIVGPEDIDATVALPPVTENHAVVIIPEKALKKSFWQKFWK